MYLYGLWKVQQVSHHKHHLRRMTSSACQVHPDHRIVVNQDLRRMHLLAALRSPRRQHRRQLGSHWSRHARGRRHPRHSHQQPPLVSPFGVVNANLVTKPITSNALSQSADGYSSRSHFTHYLSRPALATMSTCKQRRGSSVQWP